MVEGAMSGSGLAADFQVQRSEDFRLALDLSIPAGQTAALLGPNGAGKSTAVAAIAGILPIDSGHITLDGGVLDAPDADVFVPSELRGVGVVFQDYLLFPHLSVLENVAFGLRSTGMPHDQAVSRSGEWLSRLGLDGMELRKPGDLSGGQAQRVALARALVTEPKLLLLDEPLSALDVTTRAELRHTLADHLSAFEGPRLLITHDPTEAFLLADEIHVIEAGVVTQTGTADDIRLRPRTSYAADLAGSNLVAGVAGAGLVDTGSFIIHIADHEMTGPVLVTIQPTSIAVYLRRPEGSQRNMWLTYVDRLEELGSRVRLLTGDPFPLTVEITEVARTEMDLDPGSPIWVGFKATEVSIESDAAG
jgi:molybdate transport system ATP-binding protein